MADASTQQEYLIGVDLGGTKILAGVFNPQLKCLGRSNMSTKSERGPDPVLNRIARCVQDVVDVLELVIIHPFRLYHKPFRNLGMH